MKKCLISVLLGAVLLFSLSGCGESPVPPAEEFTFNGVILEVYDNSILVQLSEESSSLWSSEALYTSLSGAALESIDGDALTPVDLLVGGSVTVTFDGTIAESYPGQVRAGKVVYDGSTAPQSNISGIANPMIELDSPDFMDYTGFALVGLPDRNDLWAEKFYAYATSEKFDENIAEVYLLGNAAKTVLRVAYDTGVDISGVYEDFTKIESYSFGDIEVNVESTDYDVLATWKNYGYTFSLYLMNSSVSDALPVIEELASNVMIAVT